MFQAITALIVIAANITWLVSIIAIVLVALGADIGMSIGQLLLLVVGGMVMSYSVGLIHNAIAE